MVEMLELKTVTLVALTYKELDAIVQEFYGVTYSTLQSDEDIRNDTYLKYTFKGDYYDLYNELDDFDEQIQRWKDSDSTPLIGTAEYLRIRDEMFMPSWVVMLTFLIKAGRIPETDYLLEISW